MPTQKYHISRKLFTQKYHISRKLFTQKYRMEIPVYNLCECTPWVYGIVDKDHIYVFNQMILPFHFSSTMFVQKSFKFSITAISL